MTQNLEAILALFENGERRYDEDPAFKAVCDSLKMGLGVYAVLDRTFKENKVLREKLAKESELNKALTQAIVDLKDERPKKVSTCPECKGAGRLYKKMGSMLDKCPVCLGDKVIEHHD